VQPFRSILQLGSRLDFPIYRFQTLRKILGIQFSRFQFVVHSTSLKKKKPSDWNLRLTCEVSWKSLILDKIFDIGTEIELQFVEYDILIQDRKFLGSFSGHRRKFTVVLKVNSEEVFQMDHSIFTGNLDEAVKDIQHIIACLRDDTPLEKLVMSDIWVCFVCCIERC
jgi:hypothetical protein